MPETWPLINLLRDQMLDYDIIHMDETPVQVLKEPDKRAQSKSYIWLQRGGPPNKPVVLYDYDPGRSAQVPKRLLEGFRGYLQTDGHENIRNGPPMLAYDDHSCFQLACGGVYLFLGAQDSKWTKNGLETIDPDSEIPFNHSPRYYVKDEVLRTGVPCTPMWRWIS